jgi:hypothetical protein
MLFPSKPSHNQCVCDMKGGSQLWEPPSNPKWSKHLEHTLTQPCAHDWPPWQRLGTGSKIPDSLYAVLVRHGLLQGLSLTEARRKRTRLQVWFDSVGSCRQFNNLAQTRSSLRVTRLRLLRRPATRTHDCTARQLDKESGVCVGAYETDRTRQHNRRQAAGRVHSVDCSSTTPPFFSLSALRCLTK